MNYLKLMFLGSAITLAGSTAFAKGAVKSQDQRTDARIIVNTDRPISSVDSHIYGVFAEPIGRSRQFPIKNTIYGPVYDPSSPLANKDGFKSDYINAVRELKLTNMRWPGGNYVAAYNWQDGIGPKEKRPVRIDLAWGGYDTNQVGTDEWIQMNKAMGTENVICINLGLGDIRNAAYWLEYTNIKSGTYYSDLRAQYGHPEPYNVKIWGLGNEVDGAPWIMGYKNADDYVKIATEAAKALKMVDKDIKFVVCGAANYQDDGVWLDWDRKVIDNLTGVADYMSVHRYWGDALAKDKANDYYYSMGKGAIDFEEKILTPKALIDMTTAKYPKKQPLKLAVDEWGVFGGNYMAVLEDAMCFNSFIRHADIVKMANFTMLASLLSNDSTHGTYRSPIFHAFKMFTTNCRGVSYDTKVDCGTYKLEEKQDIPYLDVTSVTSEDGKTLFVNVVNRHKDKAITTTISNVGTYKFTGKARISTLTGDLKERFTYSKRDEYLPVESKAEVKNGQVTCSFAPHSLTQIAVPIK